MLEGGFVGLGRNIIERLTSKNDNIRHAYRKTEGANDIAEPNFVVAKTCVSTCGIVTTAT